MAEVETLTPSMAKVLGVKSAAGAMVISVPEQSSAPKGGLRALDVITEIAGQPIETAEELQGATRKMRVGYIAPISIWRDHAAKNISVKISSKQDEKQSVVPEVSKPVSKIVEPVSQTEKITSTLVVPDRPVGLEYCYVYLSSDDYQKNPDVLSPVFHNASANNSTENQIAVLKAYAAHVNRQQPGIWGTFDYQSEQCQTVSGVCWAAARKLFGPRQAMMMKCFASQPGAITARSSDEAADPTATTIAVD